MKYKWKIKEKLVGALIWIVSFQKCITENNIKIFLMQQDKQMKDDLSFDTISIWFEFQLVCTPNPHFFSVHWLKYHYVDLKTNMFLLKSRKFLIGGFAASILVKNKFFFFPKIYITPHSVPLSQKRKTQLGHRRRSLRALKTTLTAKQAAKDARKRQTNTPSTASKNRQSDRLV